MEYKVEGKTYAVYKRNMDKIRTIQDYHHLFTHTWASSNNVLNVDFQMYSSILDMEIGRFFPDKFLFNLHNRMQRSKLF